MIDKGLDQARRIGNFLVAHDLLPDLVLTSPLRRARETAEGFCAAAGIGPPVVECWLGCGMRPTEALRELAAFQGSCRRVAIVGHEPDFSGLAEHILGMEEGSVRVKKASVILLSVHPPLAGGYMHFSLWPTFLP